MVAQFAVAVKFRHLFVQILVERLVCDLFDQYADEKEVQVGVAVVVRLQERQVDDLLQDAVNNYGFKCTTNLEDIRDCNFYVVAVPTPVDKNNAPDLNPLLKASETVGKVISKGDIVVYESTVYPGVTEDECIPVVEQVSGLKYNTDFFAGYSPERIKPGDKVHTVEKIKKITSGSTPEVADLIDAVYSAVLENGTHKAPSIKVAEAAKVIENSQRDINIAFVNELAKIFNLLGIDIGNGAAKEVGDFIINNKLFHDNGTPRIAEWVTFGWNGAIEANIVWVKSIDAF